MKSAEVAQGKPTRDKHKLQGPGPGKTYKGKVTSNKKGKDHKGIIGQVDTRIRGQDDRQTPKNSILRYFSSSVNIT